MWESSAASQGFLATQIRLRRDQAQAKRLRVRAWAAPTPAQAVSRSEFRSTAAVLDCGEAHVMRPYDVQNLADRLVVTVRNGNTPLTLTLGADGALAGSGSVDVAGRLVTGVNGQDVTFAPHQERCAVGRLTYAGSIVFAAHTETTCGSNRFEQALRCCSAGGKG
jgi:hypothetical protein